MRDWQVITGDCLDVMAEMEPGSVDAVVTDPPYGLSFMGKDWDRGVPGVAFWYQAARVLKPGGHLLAFGGTRTHHRLWCAIEDAGFEVRDTLSWMYGSGFPKSLDVSKAIDKAGEWNQNFDDVREWLRAKVKAKHLKHRQIDEELGNANSHMASHFLGVSQPRLPTWKQWLIIKTLLGVDEDIERPPRCTGYERAIIGYRKVHSGLAFTSEGKTELPVTVPSLELASQWDGWGTALKPAWEPICLARKPLAGTVAANVTEHGTGAINVDGCRIDTSPDDPNHRSLPAKSNMSADNNIYGKRNKNWTTGEQSQLASTGRWPANVVLDEIVEPVLRLKYTIDPAIYQTIAESYDSYQLPELWTRVPGIPEQGQGGQGEVLQPGMLCGGAEQNHGPGSLSLWGKTHGEVSCQDERGPSRDGEAGPGESELQRALDEPGIPAPERCGAATRAGRSCSGDVGEGPHGDPRTPASNGSPLGPPAGVVRGGAPQERDQGRQPDREPRAIEPHEPQAQPPGDIQGTAQAASRKRAIEILACDIPAGWIRHFEGAGYSLRSPHTAAAMVDEQSGTLDTCGGPKHTDHNRGMFGIGRPGETYTDTGGASRFFYCAKASRGERNAGMPPGKRNHHETVKPVALMRWLVRLVTPPGGLVIDPFAGSGSTGVACGEEGFRFIGIEIDPDYADIARERIKHATRQQRLNL